MPLSQSVDRDVARRSRVDMRLNVTGAWHAERQRSTFRLAREDRTQTRRGEAYVDIVEMAGLVSDACSDLAPIVETNRLSHGHRSQGVLPDVVLYDAMAMRHDDGVELATMVHAGDTHRGGGHGPPSCPGSQGRRARRGRLCVVGGPVLLRPVRHPRGGRRRGEPPSCLCVEAALTRREVEILGDIVKGFSNVEITQRRSLSTNSVKSYIRSAYRKIGVTSRSQAVSCGLHHGFEGRDPEPEEARHGRTHIVR